MQEGLLSQDEIEEIIIEARAPIFKDRNLLHLGQNKTSILAVSPSGLILIKGNDDTGCDHIVLRHSLLSRRPFWTENNRIDNPTKFPLSVSSFDFIRIASRLYLKENLTRKKNSNPSTFDLYNAKVPFLEQNDVSCTRLTYKNTGIIHTLFLSDNKKPFNKKKIIDLRQGWVNYSHNLMKCVETYHFSYYDINNIERFRVLVRDGVLLGLEKWYLQVNYDNGSAFFTMFLGDRNPEVFGSGPRKMTALNFINILWVEKIIKKILNGQFQL